LEEEQTRESAIIFSRQSESLSVEKKFRIAAREMKLRLMRLGVDNRSH
jgi:hypothetical protein